INMQLRKVQEDSMLFGYPVAEMDYTYGCIDENYLELQLFYVTYIYAKNPIPYLSECLAEKSVVYILEKSAVEEAVCNKHIKVFSDKYFAKEDLIDLMLNSNWKLS